MTKGMTKEGKDLMLEQIPRANGRGRYEAWTCTKRAKKAAAGRAQ
jgi:hypothetical protein